jgi:uncharacterized membrane protein YdcZ (DUF606 family)
VANALTLVLSFARAPRVDAFLDQLLTPRVPLDRNHIALIVAGEMIGALAFDHFGLLGIPIHAVTPPRLVGAALLVSDAALIRL